MKTTIKARKSSASSPDQVRSRDHGDQGTGDGGGDAVGDGGGDDAGGWHWSQGKPFGDDLIVWQLVEVLIWLVVFYIGIPPNHPAFSGIFHSGWWFGCHQFYLPRNIGLLIIPIDELHHFSEGWVAKNHQAVIQ